MPKKIEYKEMMISEIVKQITESHSYLIIRISKNFVWEKGKDIVYQVRGWDDKKDSFSEDDELTGKKAPKGWVLLDAFTASGLMQIYNAITPENQAKFNRLSLNKLIDFMWAQTK